MREWLSGGASPCQGEGRGFDPRLALRKIADTRRVSAIFFEPNPGLKGFVLASGSVGSQTGVHWTPLTPVLRSIFLSGNQAVMLVSGHLYFVEFESA